MTTNEWIIVAPQRASRPHRPQPVQRPTLLERDPECPFCPGNEERTPPEIARVEGPGGWEQRVFPNLYPALGDGQSTERRGEALAREMPGIGSHEVVVESPRHNDRIEEMTAEQMTRVLTLWRDRYLALYTRPSTKAVVVFKNFGEGAGTSLPHPHSQIVATPVFPPDALQRFAVATRYFDDTGHCVYDDLLEAETKVGHRIVAERNGFLAVAPFAARSPFETWVAPREHQTSFGYLTDSQAPALAELLRDLLHALRMAAGDPDYNLVIQSAPAHEETKPFFLWHIRLVPRMATAAGFELGSGMSINTVSPEDSAALLREEMAAIAPG